MGAFEFAGEFWWPGDIDGKDGVNLKDAILALKILTGDSDNPEDIYTDGDVNNDGKIGPEEVIYILRELSAQF